MLPLLFLAGCSPRPGPEAAAAPHATQVPADEHTWRSFRVQWRRALEPHLAGTPIADLLPDGPHVFYATARGAASLDAATGQPVWSYPLPPAPGTPPDLRPLSTGHRWRLALGPDRVYLAERMGADAVAAGSPGRVRSCEPATGRLYWEQPARHAPYQLLATGSLLLTAGADGRVTALRASDGGVAWEQRWGTAVSAAAGTVRLAAGAETGAALLGDGTLLGFELKTGRLRWKRPPRPGAARVTGLQAAGNRLAAAAAGGELITLDLQTGRPGERRLPIPSVRLAELGGGSGETGFLLQLAEPPRGLAQPLVSPALQGLDTLVVTDPVTGREEWRWQPHEGFRIDRLAWHRDRLFVTDGESVYALAPGEPDPPPTLPDARKELAKKVWDRLHQGKVTTSDERREALLTLARLAPDSIEPVAKGMQTEVRLVEKEAWAASGASMEPWEPDRPLGLALNLLADMRAADYAPTWAVLLRTVRHPRSRRALAELLVRLGDPRARQALFEYAQDPQAEPAARQAALYFVCRTEPERRHPRPASEEVTAYLMQQLHDPAAPGWLRSFAAFELLNGRGAAARDAALAAMKELGGADAPIGAETDEARETGGGRSEEAELRSLVLKALRWHARVLAREPGFGGGVPFQAGTGSLVPPHFGLDGTRRPDRHSAKTLSQGFPGLRSEDGTRVRIGWDQGTTVVIGMGWGNKYDVELRRQGGRWLPVECRCVRYARSGLPDVLVEAPLVPWQPP